MSIHLNNHPRLAIIGSSGHKGEITKEQYDRARVNLENEIRSLGCYPQDIILISGGSSFIDHLAVILFLEGINIEGKHYEFGFGALVLFTPAIFNPEKQIFVPSNQYQESAATLLNELHGQFSQVVGRDSLKEIGLAKEKGAGLLHYNGFLARNRKLAGYLDNNDLCIAMTHSRTSQPKGGGTSHTWSHIKANKKHITLE